VNLLLLEPEELGPDGVFTVRDRRARHLLDVLRVQVGSSVRAGITRGALGRAEVVAAGSDTVTLALEPTAAAPPRPTIAMVVAVPRPKALPRLLGAVASMGVDRIDLVNSWRVDRSYLDSPRLAPDALGAAVRLGCEQGVTTWVPEVRVYRRFTEWLPEITRYEALVRLVAHPRGDLPIESAPLGDDRTPTVLALGPDGGWIEDELVALVDRGFVPVTLGPWVLRTEIAAPVALASLALVRRQRRVGPLHAAPAGVARREEPTD
jgi:RsmE family RNA methyltransferase